LIARLRLWYRNHIVTENHASPEKDHAGRSWRERLNIAKGQKNQQNDHFYPDQQCVKQAS
jgi:hypothetical protein